jgi:hypothetical protein
MSWLAWVDSISIMMYAVLLNAQSCGYTPIFSQTIIPSLSADTIGLGITNTQSPAEQCRLPRSFTDAPVECTLADLASYPFQIIGNSFDVPTNRQLRLEDLLSECHVSGRLFQIFSYISLVHLQT